MLVAASSKELDYRWAPATAICGIAGIVAYTLVLAAEESDAFAAALAFAFAFGLTVGSIGLSHILGGTNGSRMGLIAAVANAAAAGQLLAMLLVQMAVKAAVQQPDAAIKAVWLGLDVAWDLYIGAGTLLFGLAMFGRRGLGPWLGASGVVVGALLLIFNIATFPIPPANAGLLDAGPLVGLWYLAVYVRLGATSFLLRRQQRPAAAISG